jgi:hypothetical protein
MSTFRRELLQHLREDGFGVEALSEQLHQVIKGETVTTRYGAAGNVLGKVVKVSPEDAAKGLLLADALLGGELGLTPKNIGEAKPQDKIYERYAPPRDPRIIARQPLLQLAVEPEDPPEEPGVVLEAIATAHDVEEPEQDPDDKVF